MRKRPPVISTLVLVAVALLAVAHWLGQDGGDARAELTNRPAELVARPRGESAPPPATGPTPTAQLTVYLDAGHGGRDPGWGSSLPGMPQEKDLTLDMAKRTAAYLERDGFKVLLSRTSDTDVNEPERDLNGDGALDVVDEVQARIDAANAGDAAVMLSLHFNGLADTPLGGSSTWYNTKREFADRNKRLATLVHTAQIEALTTLGYAPRDWGIVPDDTIQTGSQAKIDVGYPHFYLIGPVWRGRPRPSRMPGVIVEPLFLTNRREAELVSRPDVRDALARAYAAAVREFLASDTPVVPGRSRALPSSSVTVGLASEAAMPLGSASSPPTEALGPATVIDRVGITRKALALTFDAGAGAGHTAAVLETLRVRGVRGTFGLTGAWCDANPDLARRITAEGHAVINHTYSHTSWTGASTRAKPLTLDQRRDEVQRAERALERTTGTSGRPYFRSPFGDRDATVQRDLGGLGYRYNVLWSYDSKAWYGARADEIIARGLQAAAPGAIYVFHVDQLQDVVALGALIDGLKAAGYSFVTVPQLLSAG